MRFKNGFSYFAMVGFLGAVALTTITKSPARAQDDPEIPQEIQKHVDSGAITKDLAVRLAREKADRRACKKEICRLFAEGAEKDGALTCDVTKTWLRQDLTEKFGGRIEWPYGHAQCKAKLNLDRQKVGALRQGAEASMTLPKHNVACTLSDTEGNEAHDVQFAIAPKIAFKEGKAVSAAINWSDIEGSTLASTAIWSAVKADSLFGVLDGIAVEQVNAFIFSKCAADGIEIAQQPE